MALKDLLAATEKRKVVAPEAAAIQQRIDAHFDEARRLIAFFREYPDLFIDFIKGPNCNFKFLFYQRIFLRVLMRHKYTYATFPRAYSKSFLAMLGQIIRCILFPGAHLFTTTGGKEQAASITMSKVEELCELIPALKAEIDWTRGVTKKTKDSVVYVFKNGSKMDILAARESSRGQRRTGGIMEECILIDKDILNEVIIPTTNVDRRLPDGSRDPSEVVNKSQVYITTAGWANSFAFEKLIELLIQSIVDPDEAMIMGGTYETPVVEGLLQKDFVNSLKVAGTFDPDSFDRQYRSIWSGNADGAFFDADVFDKHRVLQMSQNKATLDRNLGFYVFGVDVGRIGCTTEICVFYATPLAAAGGYRKSLVNIYSYEAEHFEKQAIYIKRLFYKFHPRCIAIDANGLGIGLVDFLTTQNYDDESDTYFPPFGVQNDEKGLYKKVMNIPDAEQDALFLIKADAPFNTECYGYAQMQLRSGRLKFLIDQPSARTRLMETKAGQGMGANQRAEYLRPFVQTTALRAQMLNLVETSDGNNIILKQDSRAIKKDKFSAFIYGLAYIRRYEEKAGRKKSRNFKDMLFFG